MVGIAVLVDLSRLGKVECEPKEYVYKRLNGNKLIVTNLWYRVRNANYSGSSGSLCE